MALPMISGTGFVLGEVKGMTTKNGSIMATFATAHSKSRKDESTGEWERVSQMIVNWVAFGPEAEFALEHVHAKTEVHVTGEVYEDDWTNPETGETRKSIKGTVKSCSSSFERRDRSGGGNSGGNSGPVW